MKRKFKVSELLENGINDWLSPGFYNKVSKSGWKLIEIGLSDKRRWYMTNYVIFQTPEQVEENKFAWHLFYDEGNTEYQEVDDEDNPFQSKDPSAEIEATLLQAYHSVRWEVATQ